MRNIIPILSVVATVLVGCQSPSMVSTQTEAAAQTNGPVVQFGQSDTLHSKILNQDRPYWVSLPESYHAKANRQRYPVLYVLDAEWNFYWVCEVLQFMRDSRQIPDFIVVGVPNIDREHDLTPAHDTNDISSGGGPLFERFLNEEFAPQANSHAAIFITTAGWRTLETLPHGTFAHPLSLGPAEFSNPANVMTHSQELFVSVLRTNSSPGIRVGFEVESEDHNSSRLLGLYDGLRFIFDGYKPMDPLVLNTPALINEHFDQLSNRLGFKILPPEGLVSGIGNALLDAHEPDKAVEVIKLNIRNYPTSAYAYRFLAYAYLAAGEKQLAIQNYKKALELNPNTEGVKEALAKLGEK